MLQKAKLVSVKAPKAKASFSILTAEDIRGIQHQMVVRRQERRLIRKAMKVEQQHEKEFRALVRAARLEKLADELAA